MIMKIIIKKKKIKNLILKIDEDGNLLVSAPYGLSRSFIDAFIKKKKDWIIKAREKTLKKRREIIQFKDGEKLLIFGKEYIIMTMNDKIEGCKPVDNILIISSKEDNYERKKKVFEKYIKEELKKLLIIISNDFSRKTGLICNAIKIRDMKTRWGSCNVHTHNITYNLKLYIKPIEAIEYVVLHELSHIRYPHHKKPFWDFVAKYMPDYKEKELLLKN